MQFCEFIYIASIAVPHAGIKNYPNKNGSSLTHFYLPSFNLYTSLMIKYIAILSLVS